MDDLDATHSTTITFTVLDALHRVLITDEIHSETYALGLVTACQLIQFSLDSFAG